MYCAPCIGQFRAYRTWPGHSTVSDLHAPCASGEAAEVAPESPSPVEDRESTSSSRRGVVTSSPSRSPPPSAAASGESPELEYSVVRIIFRTLPALPSMSRCSSVRKGPRCHKACTVTFRKQLFSPTALASPLCEAGKGKTSCFMSFFDRVVGELLEESRKESAEKASADSALLLIPIVLCPGLEAMPEVHTC